jgi:hypothetical protein
LSTDGERRIPLSEEFLRKCPEADLKPQEVLVSVNIPWSRKARMALHLPSQFPYQSEWAHPEGDKGQVCSTVTVTLLSSLLPFLELRHLSSSAPNYKATFKQVIIIIIIIIIKIYPLSFQTDSLSETGLPETWPERSFLKRHLQWKVVGSWIN